MAGTRKLLGEIDRTLKKVNEGVEVFDAIWDKVYSASQQNQKEKYEGELKKEIKKLQRFRDQIKSWLGNSDIKDKKALMDSRKLIENKMEQFKVCEKETKTKAYSKEGLAQKNKMDPQERARGAARGWVQDFLGQINEQMEAFECDLEKLRNQKKRQSREEAEGLRAMIARHKWHVQKLEQVTRLLDNDVLDPANLECIKDDLEYYLEANQEPEFLEMYGEDDIYEQLDLDSVSISSEVNIDTLSETAPYQPLSSPKAESVSVTIPPVNSAAMARGKSKTPTAVGRGNIETKTPSTPRNTVSSPPGKVKPQAEKKPTPQKSPTASTAKDTPRRQQPHQFPPPPPQQQQVKPRQQAPPEKSPVASSKTMPQEDNVTRLPTDLEGLTEERKQMLQLLDSSFPFVPELQDSERPKHYVPRNPYPTPAAFPSVPAALFDNPVVFEKFDTDTLFFVFYYQQGTYQQYLAARELKKQTWAYHKKYMTWFKRHEEPKVTCDEYEQGTYVYFDYETGWCQRIKSEFTFEYTYLEDELAV